MSRVMISRWQTWHCCIHTLSPWPTVTSWYVLMMLLAYCESPEVYIPLYRAWQRYQHSCLCLLPKTWYLLCIVDCSLSIVFIISTKVKDFSLKFVGTASYLWKHLNKGRSMIHTSCPDSSWCKNLTSVESIQCHFYEPEGLTCHWGRQPQTHRHDWFSSVG